MRFILPGRRSIWWRSRYDVTWQDRNNLFDMPGHHMTWHETKQSHHITFRHMTPNHIATSHGTSQSLTTKSPTNTSKHIKSQTHHFKTRDIKSHQMGTFYRQVLSLLYYFFFWNCHPRLARELLVMLFKRLMFFRLIFCPAFAPVFGPMWKPRTFLSAFLVIWICL